MMDLAERYTAPELHFISGGGLRLPALLEVAAAVLPYVDYIHLRDKQLPADAQYEAVMELHRAGIPLASIIVNDRLDVALAAGAAGVQLAGHSLSPSAARRAAPDIRIGCSVHSPAEAALAAEAGADYCLFGHVYATASKAGLPGRGLALLAEAVLRCPVPVIAIGGIRPDNAGDIIRCGAQGIAVLSGIGGSPDPAEQAKAYRRAIHEAWRERR